MFLIYKKNNKRLVSWKAYSPVFFMESFTIKTYIPEMYEEFDKLINAVSMAHDKKLNTRHELENKVIETLELISSIIEAKEGFKPIFYKEED